MALPLTTFSPMAQPNPTGRQPNNAGFVASSPLALSLPAIFTLATSIRITTKLLTQPLTVQSI